MSRQNFAALALLAVALGNGNAMAKVDDQEQPLYMMGFKIYRSCLEDAVVRYAALDGTPVSTIIEAAYGRCTSDEESFRSALILDAMKKGVAQPEKAADLVLENTKKSLEQRLASLALETRIRASDTK